MMGEAVAGALSVYVVVALAAWVAAVIALAVGLVREAVWRWRWRR